MFNKEIFRKKYLLPVTYCAVLGLAVWSGNTLIPKSGSMMSGVEPAAGEESPVPKINESELKDAPELPALEDAKELPPLRISPDKPEVVHLDRDAVNVLVGSEETLRAVPDTNRTIILIPKKPGATYFKATDGEGKIIMQRHIIVGAPERANKYLRIRRACATDDKGCKQISVYYCPDICHEVSLADDANATGDVPQDAPAGPSPDSENTQSQPQ